MTPMAANRATNRLNWSPCRLRAIDECFHRPEVAALGLTDAGRQMIEGEIRQPDVGGAIAFDDLAASSADRPIQRIEAPAVSER